MDQACRWRPHGRTALGAGGCGLAVGQVVLAARRRRLGRPGRRVPASGRARVQVRARLPVGAEGVAPGGELYAEVAARDPNDGAGFVLTRSPGCPALHVDRLDAAARRDPAPAAWSTWRCSRGGAWRCGSGSRQPSTAPRCGTDAQGRPSGAGCEVGPVRPGGNRGPGIGSRDRVLTRSCASTGSAPEARAGQIRHLGDKPAMHGAEGPCTRI